MQIRKNRWLLFGLLLACIVGVALMVMAWWPRPGINKENFDRIEIGMTRAEVEAIFGGPANRNTWADIIDDGGWDSEYGGSASIRFDKADRVIAIGWVPWPDNRTEWEKLLDRLPWRERQRRDQDMAVY